MKKDITSGVISQKQLKEYLEYKEDGHLYWIKIHPKTRKTKVGNRYGNLSKRGYIEGQVVGFRYLEHRLIWFYHHGVWPKLLDHIDGDKTNNKVENLRPCNVQNNAFNRPGNKGSSSKYKGVSWCEGTKSWRAMAGISGEVFQIGRFKTEIEAAKEYDKFVKNSHGEYMKANIMENEI